MDTTVDEVRFDFVADTTDQTATATRPNRNQGTTWTRGYRNVQAFTGGTTGIATQDSSGITIPNAGVYSFSVQIDLQIREAAQYSEVGILLHLENQAGTRIDDFTFFILSVPEVIVSATPETYPSYGSTPPLNLPAGTKAYIRVFYFIPGDAANGDSAALTHRIVTPAEDDDRVVVRRYRASGGTGGGTSTTSVSGSSIDVVYRRSSSALTVPPTGGVAQNGEVRTAPTDWSTSVPGGTDPIYTSIAHIDGATNNIRYDEPIRWTGPAGSVGGAGPPGGVGPQGPAGAKGDSIVALWRVAGTRPSTPAGLAINSSGVWTDLTANNGDVWRADPVDPTSGNNLYQQFFEVDWSGPTLTALGQPFQAFVRGQDGQRGQQGVGGQSISLFYLRTTTAGTPTTPGITYNGTAFGGFGDWVPNIIPGGAGDYLWRVAVSYQMGQGGQTVTAPLQIAGLTGPTGPAGAASDNYIPIFMRSTTILGAAPAVGTWDGTTYTPSSGWATAAPSPTTTEYVLMQWTRLTRTAPYSVTNVGVPQLSSLIAPTPPIVPTGANAQITYGLTNAALTPIGTAQTSSQVSLLVGQTHEFTLNMVTTTVAGQSWYVSVPAGFSVTSVSDSLEGDITVDWILANGRYTYGPIRISGSVGRYDFTVRRNS